MCQAVLDRRSSLWKISTGSHASVVNGSPASTSLFGLRQPQKVHVLRQSPDFLCRHELIALSGPPRDQLDCMCSARNERGICCTYNASTKVQCNATNCCNPDCTNRPFSRVPGYSTSVAVELYNAGKGARSQATFKACICYPQSGLGIGVRLSRRYKTPIPAGTFLGEATSYQRMTKLAASVAVRQGASYAIMDAQGRIFDMRACGWSAYMNSSCDPNTMIEQWEVDGGLRFAIWAIKDIKPADPLTWFYAVSFLFP